MVLTKNTKKGDKLLYKDENGAFSPCVVVYSSKVNQYYIIDIRGGATRRIYDAYHGIERDEGSWRNIEWKQSVDRMFPFIVHRISLKEALTR